VQAWGLRALGTEGSMAPAPHRGNDRIGGVLGSRTLAARACAPPNPLLAPGQPHPAAPALAPDRIGGVLRGGLVRLPLRSPPISLAGSPGPRSWRSPRPARV